PDRALAYVSESTHEKDFSCVIESFQIGSDRLFENNPRFGHVDLSEIAVRALSPAVNDPATAISVISSLLRLFNMWAKQEEDKDTQTPKYDRIAAPEISLNDMFDDAFTAIARDGAGMVEVSVRLQKAFGSLVSTGHPDIRDAALYHGQLAL